MISAPAPSEPMCSRVSCWTVLTVAAVPTGMKTGVWTAPCGRCSAARRPPVCAVALISKARAIYSVCLLAGQRSVPLLRLLGDGDGLGDAEVVGYADEVAVFSVLPLGDGLEEDGFAVDVGVEHGGLPVGLTERRASCAKGASGADGREQAEADAHVLRQTSFDLAQTHCLRVDQHRAVHCMEHALFHRLRRVVRIGLEVDALIAALFAFLREEKCVGEKRQQLPRMRFVILERLRFLLEGGRVGDDGGQASPLLGDALRAQRLAIFFEQHAYLARVRLDDFFRPEMSAGAV